MLPLALFHSSVPLSTLSLQMSARPTVTVHAASTGAADGSLPLPSVLTAPVRRDVVATVHALLAKNGRQVRGEAAVFGVYLCGCPPERRPLPAPSPPTSLLPPVGVCRVEACRRADFGHLLGYGSRCGAYPSRGWRRHAPLRPGRVRQHVPRRPHVCADEDLAPVAPPRERCVSCVFICGACFPRDPPRLYCRTWSLSISTPLRLQRFFSPPPPDFAVRQRRYAIVSALAASAVPALVMARGHRVEGLPEIPLVVSGLESVTKTSEAVAALQKLGAAADVERVEQSKAVRAGKGKGRNRRYISRRGPLLVTASSDSAEVSRAFRNLAGVDVAHVDRLSLLQLAPGGHMGRFVVWTKAAFAELEHLYGTAGSASERKAGYKLPRAVMANADLARIINSAEIQKVVRPAVKSRAFAKQKKNPLKNKKVMDKLNPYAKVIRAAETKKAASKAKVAASKRGGTRGDAKRRAASKGFFRSMVATDYVRPNEAKA